MIRITPKDEHFEANLRELYDLSRTMKVDGDVAVLHIAPTPIQRVWFYNGPPQKGAGDFIEVNGSQRIFYESIHEICYRIGRKEE